MDNIYEKARETASFIKRIIKETPEIAIVLGSGLGPLADEIENKVEIDYKDVPNFPGLPLKGMPANLYTEFWKPARNCHERAFSSL